MDGLTFSRKASAAKLHRNYWKIIKFLTLLQCRTQVVVSLLAVMSSQTLL